MQKTHFMSAFSIYKISVIKIFLLIKKSRLLFFYRFISTEITVATSFSTVNFTS